MTERKFFDRAEDAIKFFLSKKKDGIKASIRSAMKGKTVVTFYGKKSNPSNVRIYENVLRIEAQKGPGHVCDPGCKKANHCYYHNFKRPYPEMLGLPDKSILIRSKK